MDKHYTWRAEEDILYGPLVVGSTMYANVLCDLPDVDIDEEGNKAERARAYLDSVIREVRESGGGASSVTWQFSFDIVHLRHAHGTMLVVASDAEQTRIWGLTETSSQHRTEVRKDGRFTKLGTPRPDHGQFVASVNVGFASLTGGGSHGSGGRDHDPEGHVHVRPRVTTGRRGRER